MTTSLALPRPPYAVGALPVLVALIAVFIMGALSGYLVRPSSPAASAQQTAVSACPAGTHVTVWYTARTWACVSDASS